ncbi:tRNA (adenosine(37)-N6)-threonylcarbamoyltransferase complex transferase subunit TsaD [bacterium]|nr:tRNA (adenosine(37)-N6)-threonylcarbamoyltransferase complex transferase subunit TsaD [bacterium]
MIILGIETSCDDSGVGLYCSERKTLASLLATQLEHRDFGGIVPEVASRAHLKNLPPVLRAALADAGLGLAEVDAIAVTRGPGLLGSLLVGLAFAQALGEAWRRPVLGVHHIEAHLASNHLERDMVFPALALVVSGGHSQIFHLRAPGDYVLLATTRDDAAGEAFDKAAKLAGLGFPGGPIIERLALTGDPRAFAFPLARLGDRSLDFSFSGLKTAARLAWEQAGPLAGQGLADYCASFQAAVIRQLLDRLERALRGREAMAVYIAGGVAANRALLAAARDLLEPRGLAVHAPRPRFCTDNGAMVACAGAWRLAAGRAAGASLAPFSRGGLRSWGVD